MRGILIFFITLYKWTLSPLLGPCCRFHPSCSEYAREAIEEYGAARGLRLAVRRLLHCHPFHPGGYDPVPMAPPAKKRNAQQPTLNIQRPTSNVERPGRNTPDLDVRHWPLVVGRSFFIPHWLGRPSIGDQSHTMTND